jgi:hypothetical protein
MHHDVMTMATTIIMPIPTIPHTTATIISVCPGDTLEGLMAVNNAKHMM